MKVLFRVIVALLVVILIWYLAADRATPFTSNARVKAVIKPIVPQVSGTIVEVPISNAEGVEAGTVLARIDPRRFEIARNRAQAALESATQSVGASSADVERAQAQLVRAQGDLENMRLQTSRVFELEKKGLVTVARADDARTQLSDAEGLVEVATADLTRAQQNLGPSGQDNPEIQAALADLADAELDLTFTEIKAPAFGAVLDLTVAEGAQAQAGQSLMTFVDARDIWIEAYLTENNHGKLWIGAPVSVVLDAHPGKVFEGRVESLTPAASLGNPTRDGLPRPPSDTGWLRAPQRFPVRIVLPGFEAGNPDDELLYLINGQADVIVFTGDSAILNTLGRAYIRAVSWLSYAY